jgi:hypothetical protein
VDHRLRGAGPFGLKPEELERAIKAELDRGRDQAF